MEAKSSEHGSTPAQGSAASVTPKKVPSKQPSTHRPPVKKRVIDSMSSLFCYVLITAMMVAIAASIIIGIVTLNNIINNPQRDPDAPFKWQNLTTTTPATADALTTTKAALLGDSYSEDIKKFMDLSISPCEDFYTHACGGWHKMIDIKDSVEEKYLASPREVNILEDLKAMLEKPINENDPIYKNQVRKFYAACNDQAKLEARGPTPFRDFMSSLGKFGLLDNNYNSKNLTLREIIGKLTAMGIEPLFKVRRLNTADFSGFLISPVNIPGVSYEKEWMEKTLKPLGTNTEEAVTISHIDNALEFQNKLHEISIAHTGSIKSKKTILDLKTLLPDWISPLEFFTELSSSNTGKMANLTEQTEVMVENPGYFTEIRELFKYHTEGGTAYNADHYYRATDDYVLRTLLNLSPLLGSSYTSLKEHDSDFHYNRAKTCIDLVGNLLQTHVIKMYIDESYNSKPDAYVKDMITDLKSALRQRVTDSAKIKEEDKKLAYDKLDNMQAKVGYVEGVYDEKVLNNIYKWGPTEELFEAYIASLKYEFNKTLWSDDVNWLSEHNSFTTEAVHLADENYLVVPAVHLLITPLLNLSLPSSMNYGSMGFLLGYLITKPWLETQHITPSVYANNPEKEECFVKEYNNFMFDKFKVNGRSTLYENVVDNEAIKASYKAYENFMKRKGNEPEVAQASLSHDKMFFISFAQMMCQVVPSDQAEEVLGRPLAPNKIRVLGSLRNFNTFAEAFKCKTDAPMNPESKCQKF